MQRTDLCVLQLLCWLLALMMHSCLVQLLLGGLVCHVHCCQFTVVAYAVAPVDRTGCCIVSHPHNSVKQLAAG
jgi:hypothetical protein